MCRKLIATVMASLLCAGLLSPSASAQTSTATNGMLSWARGFSGYYSNTNGVMIGNPDRSGFKQIQTGGQSPDWSPDGNRIAYDDGSEIRVMKSDGTGDFFLAYGANPSWSPNSAHNKIAYPAGDGTAWVISATAGAQPTQILSDCWVHPMGKMAWNPAGTKVAFSGWCWSDTENTGPSLYVTNADSFGTEWKKLVPYSLSNVTGISWSPDGTRIAASILTEVPGGCSQGFQSDIYMIPVDHDGAATGSADRITETIACQDARESWPDWSPDGTKIVFGRDHSWSESGIAGSGIATMTPSGAELTMVAPIYHEDVDTTTGETAREYVPQREPSWQPCVEGVTLHCDATEIAGPNPEPTPNPTPTPGPGDCASPIYTAYDVFRARHPGSETSRLQFSVSTDWCSRADDTVAVQGVSAEGLTLASPLEFALEAAARELFSFHDKWNASTHTVSTDGSVVVANSNWKHCFGIPLIGGKIRWVAKTPDAFRYAARLLRRVDGRFDDAARRLAAAVEKAADAIEWAITKGTRLAKAAARKVVDAAGVALSLVGDALQVKILLATLGVVADHSSSASWARSYLQDLAIGSVSGLIRKPDLLERFLSDELVCFSGWKPSVRQSLGTPGADGTFENKEGDYANWVVERHEGAF